MKPPEPVTPGATRGFDLYADGGTVHLLVAEQTATPDGRTLLHRRSTDGGRTWTPPVRVEDDSQRVFPAHIGGEPQVAAAGSRLVAAWTGIGTGWGGAGALVTAVSGDGGVTWHPGPNPADDGSTEGHAFIDLASAGGAFHMVWLDSRSGAQGLRHARSADGLAWSANATVEPHTCACCWNALASRPNGTVAVLYRADAPRDMALAVSGDVPGVVSWDRKGRAGRFDWEAKACPHTGGGLAVTGRSESEALHALVWTGGEAAAGLHYLASGDGGTNWTEPRRLGGPDAQRADLAARGSTLAAVWDEIREGRRAVFAAESRNGGTDWTAPRTLSRPDAEAQRPRVVATDRGFLAAWTETEPGAAPRTAFEVIDGR